MQRVHCHFIQSCCQSFQVYETVVGCVNRNIWLYLRSLLVAPGEFHQTICMTKAIFEVCAVASFGCFNTVLDYDSSQSSFELQHIFGLLLHPNCCLILLKRSSMESWENLYVRIYLNGHCFWVRSFVQRAITDSSVTVKPQIAIFHLLWCNSQPCSTFRLKMSSLIELHWLINAGNDSLVTGALDPFARGFLLFSASNATSIFLTKVLVALLSWNCSRHASSHKKSIAVATEELTVCTSRLTFILCFVQPMCLFFSLFAKLSPISSWSMLSAVMYFHLISCVSPLILFEITSKSAKKFWIGDNMWHASKMMKTFSDIFWGCGNQVCKFETCNLHPRHSAVCWFV